MLKLEGELAKYSYIRGFNYQPSYAAHGVIIWGDQFDINKFDHEIGLGKKYFPHINTIRIWLSHEAYLQNPKQFCKHVDQVIDLCDKHDVKMIMMLFSGWHSIPDFGGLSIDTFEYATRSFEYLCEPYIRDIVGKHADDSRVLFWDLCNEPLCTAKRPEDHQIVFDCLKKVYDSCKGHKAQSPITVGTIPGMLELEIFEPISDVLSTHPYYAHNAWIKDEAYFTEHLDEMIAFAQSVNKPLFVSECCWGSYDDADRCNNIKIELTQFTQRNMGFLPHLLHETYVADGHRPEMAMTAHPLKNVGYMAFINMDGTLRPGHEIYNQF